MRITQRFILLLQFDKLIQRAPRYHTERNIIEKRNTLERRRVQRQLIALEFEIREWLAKTTQHPDLYSPHEVLGDPLELSTFSKRERLRRRWLLLSRRTGVGHPQRKEVNRHRTIQRHRLAVKIQDLDYAWFTALTLVFYDEYELPPRRMITARNFRP